MKKAAPTRAAPPPWSLVQRGPWGDRARGIKRRVGADEARAKVREGGPEARNGGAHRARAPTRRGKPGNGPP